MKNNKTKIKELVQSSKVISLEDFKKLGPRDERFNKCDELGECVLCWDSFPENELCRVDGAGDLCLGCYKDVYTEKKN